MSAPTKQKTSQLFAAATALCAIGFLTVPAPAQARPPLPLAPPCDNYQFPPRFTFRQDNGITVDMSNSATTTFHGDGAQYANANASEMVIGHAVGGITGQTIDFTINWDSGFSNHYTGVVNGNNTAQGMSVNNHNTQNVWASGPLSCVTPPVDIGRPDVVTDTPPVSSGPTTPQSPPPPPTTPQSPPPPPTTATVTSDVDTYQSVDPNTGGVNNLGTLRKGSQVQLIGACAKQDWCHVSGPTVPAGDGWVWGALKF
jgi:hypothetical protein